MTILHSNIFYGFSLYLLHRFIRMMADCYYNIGVKYKIAIKSMKTAGDKGNEEEEEEEEAKGSCVY